MSSRGDFEICDDICYSYSFAYFAADDDKDILWLNKTLFGFIFPVDYQYQYEAIEGQ